MAEAKINSSYTVILNAVAKLQKYCYYYDHYRTHIRFPSNFNEKEKDY